MNRAGGGIAARATPRVLRRALIGIGLVLLAFHALVMGAAERAGAAVAVQEARLRIDPNVASREELMLLPRIGPVLADYIIEYRQTVGPRRAFECAEDLQNVKRIGPVTVESLRPLLRFPAAPATQIGAEASGS